MPDNVTLRDANESDIPIFFTQQLDPAANHMAAFTAKDPADVEGFTAKWHRILSDDSITKRTVLVDGAIAGSIVAFHAPWSGKLEVSYWLGREFWGRGIATKALSIFLDCVTARPIFASVAADNVASIRALEKCGFVISGRSKGFANARGMEIEEVSLELGEAELAALDRVADLSDAERDEVRALSLAVYPPKQFAEWPGQHMEWSSPEWCVRVRDQSGRLLSYVGVYMRAGENDNRPASIGGIGNVKTHPKARGRGLARRAIHRAVQFLLEQRSVAFAVLVCEPSMVEYYVRLGWRIFDGRLLIRQRGEETEYTLNRVMTLALQSPAPSSGIINLCGPPW